MSVSDPTPPPVKPGVALSFAAVGFVSLTIMGFGLSSLVSGDEVINVQGLGQLPGIVGMALAVAAFVATLWIVLRGVHPSFIAVFAIVPTVFVAYLVGLGVAALGSGVDAAQAFAAIGSVATSWTAVVIAAAAAISSWAAIALVRTHKPRPQWPWEGDADEE